MSSPGGRGLASRLLLAFELEPRAFLALLRAFILMDLRGTHYGRATATGPQETLPPLFWVVGQCLALSAFLSAALFARVDVEFFAFAGLAAQMTIVLAALIVELDEAALQPNDVLVVGHRPVPPRTYSAARVGNLVFFVALMTAALSVFPAIVGAGLRDAGPLYLPAYLLASAVGSLSLAGAVLIVVATFGLRDALDPAKNILAWAQIVLLGVVFYGAQLMLRQGEGGVELLAARPPSWLRFLPPSWLAVEVARASREPAFQQLPRAAAAVGVALALSLGAVWRLSVAWSALGSGAPAWRRVSLPPPPVPGTVLGPLVGRLVRSREEGAALWLTRTLLRRDVDIKMRTWPALATAGAALALAVLTRQCGDPFVARDTTVVLPVAVFVLLGGAVPAVVFGLSSSRDHEAAWLLLAAPLAGRERFLSGVRKAVLVSVFLPFAIVAFATLAVVWENPLHAAAHVAAGWVLIEGAARISVATVLGEMPFSRPPVRGASLGPVMLPVAAIGSAAAVLGALEILAFRRAATAVVYALALVVALVLAELWTRKRLGRPR